jgi:hypothetical protein
MQGVLAATCTLFGVLWLRAVARVKCSIARRSAMVQRLAGASGSLSEETLQRVIDGVVRLQANVRRRQATVATARMVAMDAYEASTPYRNHMLLLLNMVVGLYLASCLYIIALYGTSGQGAAVGRWGVIVSPFGLEGPAEWRLGAWVGGGWGDSARGRGWARDRDSQQGSTDMKAPCKGQVTVRVMNAPVPASTITSESRDAVAYCARNLLPRGVQPSSSPSAWRRHGCWRHP